MRGNGERIGPQNLPTSSIAGGVWNLLNQQRAQQRGAWPSATPAVVTDPYFMYVPLLLNTTSTNAQQNNTFLDSSTNNFTITRNGTPTQGAFTPYQPSGYWSGFFPGSSYLTRAFTSTTDGMYVQGSTYTIETWVYPQALSGTQYIYICNATNTASFGYIALYFSGTTLGFATRVSTGGTEYNVTGGTLTNNQWAHIAVCVNSNTAKLFLNGVQVGTNLTVAANTFTPTGAGIGFIQNGFTSGLSYFSGYMSGLRITQGQALASGNFTPPIVPVTTSSVGWTGANAASSLTGTVSFLTLQDNRFIDNSTNAFAITVNGTPKVQAFQPFAPAASYSAATYGGSGYFDGTNDYLSLNNSALSIGTSTATVEFWMYPFSTSGYKRLVTTNASFTSASFVARYNNGTFIAGSGTTNASTATLPPAYAWTHVAWVGVGGTNQTLFINGANVATAGSYNITETSYAIGGEYNLERYNGYISNLRMVKGAAVYTGNFTPPTLAPLTTAGSTSAASYPSTTNVNTSFAASSTSLLTNFTNAGIYDAAWQNNALTVGDAQASTTQYKWSPTSMKFDGTGDYLTMPINAGTTITTGDFTVEFWLYPSTVATAYQAIVGTREGDTSATINWSVLLQANQLRTDVFTSAGVSMAGFLHQTVLSASNWYYCALVRSGSTFTLYVNGVASTTTSTSSATIGQSGTTLWTGRFGASSSVSALNGYIQDLRITKGVARTITTPTAAFPTR